MSRRMPLSSLPPPAPDEAGGGGGGEGAKDAVVVSSLRTSGGDPKRGGGSWMRDRDPSMFLPRAAPPAKPLPVLAVFIAQCDFDAEKTLPSRFRYHPEDDDEEGDVGAAEAAAAGADRARKEAAREDCSHRPLRPAYQSLLSFKKGDGIIVLMENGLPTASTNREPCWLLGSLNDTLGYVSSAMVRYSTRHVVCVHDTEPPIGRTVSGGGAASDGAAEHVGKDTPLPLLTSDEWNRSTREMQEAGGESAELGEIQVYLCKRKLIELLAQGPNYILLQAIEQALPSSKQDFLKYVAAIYTTLRIEVDVVLCAVQKEVHFTSYASTMFRQNSLATRLLVHYGRVWSAELFDDILKPLIWSIVHDTADYEVDPIRLMGADYTSDGTDADEEVKQTSRKNMLRLAAAASRCFDTIEDWMLTTQCEGFRNIRRVCVSLYNAVEAKFPGQGMLAVGGFVFLRLISPSFVTPDKFDLIATSALSPAARRKTILVSKVLQNISNHQLFGAKDEYLVPMNDLVVADMIPRAKRIQRFLAGQGRESDKLPCTELTTSARSVEPLRASELPVSLIELLPLNSLLLTLDEHTHAVYDAILQAEEDLKSEGLAARETGDRDESVKSYLERRSVILDGDKSAVSTGNEAEGESGAGGDGEDGTDKQVEEEEGSDIDELLKDILADQITVEDGESASHSPSSDDAEDEDEVGPAAARLPSLALSVDTSADELQLSARAHYDTNEPVLEAGEEAADGTVLGEPVIARSRTADPAALGDHGGSGTADDLLSGADVGRSPSFPSDSYASADCLTPRGRSCDSESLSPRSVATPPQTRARDAARAESGAGEASSPERILKVIRVAVLMPEENKSIALPITEGMRVFDLEDLLLKKLCRHRFGVIGESELASVRQQLRFHTVQTADRLPLNPHVVVTEVASDALCFAFQEPKVDSLLALQYLMIFQRMAPWLRAQRAKEDDAVAAASSQADEPTASKRSRGLSSIFAFKAISPPTSPRSSSSSSSQSQSSASAGASASSSSSSSSSSNLLAISPPKHRRSTTAVDGENTGTGTFRKLRKNIGRKRRPNRKGGETDSLSTDLEDGDGGDAAAACHQRLAGPSAMDHSVTPKPDMWIMDVVAADSTFRLLRLGTVFLKGARKGKPRKKFVCLSGDRQRLQWADDRTAAKWDDGVDVTKIVQVTSGIKSKTGSSSTCGLTLTWLDDGAKKAIELHGTSVEECEAWYVALQLLLKKTQWDVTSEAGTQTSAWVKRL